MKRFKTFLSGWARTDKLRSELRCSIIIHVKHYICRVKGRFTRSNFGPIIISNFFVYDAEKCWRFENLGPFHH